jgi:PAS domain S-box-containing protein
VAAGEDVSEPVEYRWKVKSGEYRWFSDSRKLVQDEKGQVIAIVGISRDITERKKTENSLRNTERLLSAVTSGSSDAIYVKDCQSRWLFVNPALERIIGKPSSELLGKNDLEIYANPEIGKTMMTNDLRVMKSGKAETIEETVETSDGPRHFISEKVPRFDDKGQVIGLIGISRDFTDRKKAEEELKDSGERLQHALEAGELGLWGLDVITGKAWRTLQHDKIFGYNSLLPEWTYQMFLSHVLPEDRAMVDEKFGGAVSRGTEWNFECRIQRHDGQERWIWAQGKPKFDEKHAIVQMIGLVKDTTESKKALEATAKQAELIDLSPDAIIVRKLDGTITFWSKGAKKLYGWNKEEAVGQIIHTLLKTEFPQPLVEVLKMLKLDGKWSGELSHTCKNGDKVVVQSYWLGKFNVEGKIVEMLESNVDITERIRLQSKLEESAVVVEEYANQMEELANKRAEQLKDAERLATIGATAGMVGHDIRNPLQAITGDVFLAKTDLIAIPESEEKTSIQESLSEIEKNVDYINKIVADLQDFARPLKPNAEETDLKLVIDDLLKKNGLPGNVKVTVKVEADARKVVADSTFINRIMYNLVTNAVQAMPKGGNLTIHACKEAKDILITVKDTGVGIPEKVKEKLFTPMFTTKSKGQGFGLAVIKRMTEALGGTVTFESQEGKGTTFIIRLPPKELNGKSSYK